MPAHETHDNDVHPPAHRLPGRRRNLALAALALLALGGTAGSFMPHSWSDPTTTLLRLGRWVGRPMARAIAMMGLTARRRHHPEPNALMVRRCRRHRPSLPAVSRRRPRLPRTEVVDVGGGQKWSPPAPIRLSSIKSPTGERL